MRRFVVCEGKRKNANEMPLKGNNNNWKKKIKIKFNIKTKNEIFRTEANYKRKIKQNKTKNFVKRILKTKQNSEYTDRHTYKYLTNEGERQKISKNIQFAAEYSSQIFENSNSKYVCVISKNRKQL